MTLLEVGNITAFYGDFQALYGVDLSVKEGECLGLVGANGAGKSTLMRVISGSHGGAVSGALTFRGDTILRSPAHKIVAKGIVLIPEGRKLFRSLTVAENLMLAAESGRKGHWNLERVYDLFPILREFANRPSTSLSGGQQQMVAIGRGLLGNPSLLMCDELSLGLAPIVIKDIYRSLERVAKQGTSLLIVEQDVEAAKRVCDTLVCMRGGRVVLTGTPATITPDQITTAYFGEGA